MERLYGTYIDEAGEAGRLGNGEALVAESIDVKADRFLNQVLHFVT